ncbi:MAG: DUF4430 domain-containing protein [Gaiellales bacterium]
MGSRHHILLTALALAGAAGGGSPAAAPPSGPAAVTVVVTRDFGARELLHVRQAPGQSALNALRRSAQVTTSYEGRFVESIAGLHGDRSAGRDWLYFVNGIDADRGAADYTLAPGDQEWWDYRYWNDLLHVPVAVGAWPEPFVHGYLGHLHPVYVAGPACAARVTAALRHAGARITASPSAYSVQVATFAQIAGRLSDWQGKGLTVSLKGGTVAAYRGHGTPQPVTGARALIVAYADPTRAGDSAHLVVAGIDRAAACAAVDTLTRDGPDIARTYAVALDAAGNVIAVGGRP